MTRPLRLTLDNDCYIPLVDDSAGSAFRAELDVLRERAERGTVELYVTGTTDRELQRGDGRHAPTRDAPIAGMVPGMARLDIMGLDDPNTVLAPDAATDWDRVVRRILLPEGLWPGASAEKQLSDVDQVLAHKASGNDLFVTANKRDFTPQRVAALRAEGVVVVNPKEVLELLGPVRGDLY